MTKVMTLLYNFKTGRNIFRPVVVLLFVASLFGLNSCGSGVDDDQDNDFDRAVLLDNWCDNLIIPSYENYYNETLILKDAVELFADDPTNIQNFESCRVAFISTYLSWQEVALYDFGPASNRALLSTTNTYPTDIDKINQAVPDDNWTPGSPATLDNIGLPAIDYLLNADDAFNQLSNSPDRLAHLVRLIQFMKVEAEAVYSDWTTTYGATFKASTGTEMGSSIGEVLNAFNKVYETYVRKQKLGLPTGIMTLSGTPLPGHVEAYYAQNLSVDLLASAILPFENIYLGNYYDTSGILIEGMGIDDYLISFGDVEYGSILDSDIKAQIISSKQAISTLENPLSDYVVNNTAEANEVYQELQALVVLWKVDMMGALGVLVTYIDNDGD